MIFGETQAFELRLQTAGHLAQQIHAQVEVAQGDEGAKRVRLERLRAYLMKIEEF